MKPGAWRCVQLVLGPGQCPTRAQDLPLTPAMGQLSTVQTLIEAIGHFTTSFLVHRHVSKALAPLRVLHSWGLSPLPVS